MHVYDTANKLADDIQQCEEYKAYKEIKDRVYADESKKAMKTE